MRATVLRVAWLGARCALLLGIVATCSNDSLPTAPSVSPDAVLAAVTTELAASVDAEGKFLLVGPPVGVMPLVTQARARALALAYFRTYEESLRDRFRRERWGLSLAGSLTVCPRAYYAESGYDKFGPEVSSSFRRTFGDQWIIGLCSRGEQQAAIAVSVDIDDVVIDADGTLGGNRAGNFFSEGVRPGTTIPATPEWAAVKTSEKVEALVSVLPVLRRRARGFAPFEAVWVLPIDREASVSGLVSGADRITSELAYGISNEGEVGVVHPNPEFANEPREEPITGPGSAIPLFVVTRRADVPLRYEIVARRRD